MEWDEAKLAAVRDEHEEWLLRQPFVSGTGIGYDEQGRLCLKVLTHLARAEDRDKVRAHLQGAPVYFEETGPIDAL